MKSLTTHLDAFVDNCIARRMHPKNVSIRRSRLAAFVRWLADRGVTTADRLERVHLEHWLGSLVDRRAQGTKLPLKASYREAEIKRVRLFCRWLAIKGHVTSNLQEVFQGLRTPVLLPRPTPDHATLRRLLLRMPQKTARQKTARVFAEVLYSSGMRPCELLALNLHDVDWEEGTARVFAKGVERIVFLGRIALKHLTLYRHGLRPLCLRDPREQALCLNEHGRRLGYGRFNHLLCQNLPLWEGKPLRAYVFRRAYATELIRSGASPWIVKEALGHATLHLLKHYVQLTIVDLQKTHARCHPRDRIEVETSA